MSVAVKSLLGPYSDKLQVMIDASNSRFAPLWYPSFFGFSAPQTSLTFVSVIGKNRIEAAASVVNRDSQSPLRSRDMLQKLPGEIPAIKEKIKMSETEAREFLSLQEMNIDDTTKKNALLEMLFGDVKRVGDSVHKRLDIMCLEAVSTGAISMSITNNPDGLILDTAIDLLMPAANKVTAGTVWATQATCTPITDIETMVTLAKSKGVTFSKILMSDAMWYKFKAAKQTIDMLGAYFYGPKTMTFATTTLERTNEFLNASRLPVIEIVDQSIGIEKDGQITTLRPFNANAVSFIPAGNLGTIRNAISIEQIKPVPQASYATYKSALISKWSENEPFAEYTKSELNAFPAFEQIDSVYILTA